MVPWNMRQVGQAAFAPLAWAIVTAGLIVSQGAAQQTGQLIVRVVNGETNQPLGGVQVSIRETGLGGLTNNQGQFLIPNAPVGQRVVVAQLIGYGDQRQNVTVTADGSAAVRFEMFPRAVELEGLVVTGTAIAATRREVGNSIALITADQIAKVGAINFEDILRGRALGVSVTGSSGTAGAGSDLLLRGVHSVNGRNRPLVYIDGVRMPTELPEGSTGESQEHASFLGSISPQDIERIEVIKGAAASTLYGTEASAGVIQIFTKKGQAGAPRWTLSTSQGVSVIGHVGPEMDPTGLHVNDCTRQFVFNDQTMEFELLDTPEPACPSSGKWVRDAHVQDYQLNVRGGTDDISYYASGSWNRTNGVITPQNARQLSLRGNFTFDGFRNVQLTLNSFYSRRDIRWIPGGDNSGPNIPGTDKLEGFLANVARGDDPDGPAGNDDAHVLDMELDQFINHFNSSANINWNQRDNVRHRLNVGLDYTNSHYIEGRPWLYYSFPAGDRSVDIENRRVITVDYAASWNANLGDFSSTLSLGGQYNQNEHLGLRGDTEIFLGPGDKVLQNGEDDSNQEDRDVIESGGFFVQEQLGFKNRLFITGGLRFDSHSAFGNDYTRDEIFTVYPKLQGTYTLSDHSFWPVWWNTFRLRAAYGESGDPPGFDDAVTLFQVAGADDNKTGFIIFNQGNQEIGPERAKEFEAGFDIALFNSRANLTVTGYNRTTVDGRIFIDPPPSNGIAENIPLNVGEWKSKGYEAAVDVVAWDRDPLRLNLRAGYQFNQTKMVELGARQFDAFNFNYLNSYRRGFPLPSMFGRELLNRDSVGQLPVYSTDQNFFFGTTRPPREYSLGGTLTLFRRLTLDAFGIGQYGHVVYDDLAQEMAEDGIWPPCIPINARVQAGDFADIPTRDIAKCALPYAFDGVNDNQDWAESASYFRLQSATLSYRVPERFLPGRMSAATLQLQATNLFTITNFSGLYPDALIRPLEQTARGAGYILPPPHTYTFNVRVSF